MKKYLCGIPVLMFSGLAMAHPGHGDQFGMVAGAIHTLSGVDHLLMMLGAGVIAAQQGRRGVTFLATFAASLLAGFAIAAWLPVMAVIEQGIVFGLMVLGMLLIFCQSDHLQAPLSQLSQLSRVLVPLMGFCHGLAHGWEVPAEASLAGFAVGFMLASTFVMMGTYAVSRRISQRGFVALTGIAIASGGVLLAL